MRTRTARATRHVAWWTTAIAAAWLTGCATSGPREPISFTSSPWVEKELSGRRLVTEHFDIWSTLRDGEFEVALPEFLELAYSHYVATIPPPEGESPRLNVYILGTPSEWAQFVMFRQPPGVDIHMLTRADGFTHESMSACVYEDRATTLAALAHECWHQYIGTRSSMPIPAWLDEGLGCCFEVLQVSNGKRKYDPARNSIRLKGLREAIGRGKLLPLEMLVISDAASISGHYNADLTQTYYAQVWALVTFLRDGADGRFAKDFDHLLDDVGNGRFLARVSAHKLQAPGGDEIPFGEAAFQAYFKTTTKALSDDYYGYLFDRAE